MAKYRFGDVVKEVKINVNRDNNPYEFYVAGDHLDSEDLIIRRKGRFSTDDVGPAFTRIFHPGQVLYGSRRTYLKKVAIADFDGICANTTFVLETKDNNIFTQELLPFIMLSDRFTEWSVSHSKGSTNPYVLFSDLADFEIELPDINSQRSLAKKLASAHNVKESYKTLLKCTDELVKSQFIEMFGSIDNNKHRYPVCRISEVCDILNGYAFQSKKYVDTGIRVIRIANVQKGYIEDTDPQFYPSSLFDEYEKYMLFENDLLLSLTGNVGRVGLLPKEMLPAALNQRVACIRPTERINKTFLFKMMNLDSFEKDCIDNSSGSAQKNMSTEWLKRYKFILPPMYEQKKFVRISEQADKSKQIAFSRAS